MFLHLGIWISGKTSIYLNPTIIPGLSSEHQTELFLTAGCVDIQEWVRTGKMESPRQFDFRV